MANLKAKVRNTSGLKGKTRSQTEIVAQTVQVQGGNIRLGDLADVNTNGESDGVMMIYNATSGK